MCSGKRGGGQWWSSGWLLCTIVWPIFRELLPAAWWSPHCHCDVFFSVVVSFSEQSITDGSSAFDPCEQTRLQCELTVRNKRLLGRADSGVCSCARWPLYFGELWVEKKWGMWHKYNTDTDKYKQFQLTYLKRVKAICFIFNTFILIGECKYFLQHLFSNCDIVRSWENCGMFRQVTWKKGDSIMNLYGRDILVKVVMICKQELCKQSGSVTALCFNNCSFTGHLKWNHGNVIW